MTAFARCLKDNHLLRFVVDRLGRVHERCPVCDDGERPVIPARPDVPVFTEGVAKSSAGGSEAPRAEYPTKYCDYEPCGQPFSPCNWQQVYCSPACRRKVRTALVREYRAGTRRQLKTRWCRWEKCRKEFRAINRRHEFCTPDCRTGYVKDRGVVVDGRSVCRNGHLWVETNIEITPSGALACVTCRRKSRAAYMRRRNHTNQERVT